MKPKQAVGFFFLFLLLSGCVSEREEALMEQAAQTTFEVAAVQGPAALGFVKAMEPSTAPGVRLGDTVYYTFAADESQLYAQLLEGEFDLALLPTEQAARLYNEGGEYQLVAVSSGGYLFVLAKEGTITRFSDLAGKVVSIAGQGSAADVVFRALALQNGLDPDTDLTLQYAANPAEQVQNAGVAAADALVLPEPWVTELLNQNGNYRFTLDLQAEWAQLHGTEAILPQACLVAKNGIATQKAEPWPLFLADYQDSIGWVTRNPQKTASLLERHDVGVPPEAAEEVLSRAHLLYLDAASARPAVEQYLSLFLEHSPESIGGRLPDDGFYFTH